MVNSDPGLCRYDMTNRSSSAKAIVDWPKYDTAENTPKQQKFVVLEMLICTPPLNQLTQRKYQ